MKKIICSHVDLDGIGNIILYKYFNLPFDKYLILDYDFEQKKDEVFEELLKYDEIVVTDFSFSEEMTNKLLSLNKKLIICDHHDFSLYLKDMKHENLKVFHSLEICGTKIFWENYIKPTLKRYPKIIEEFVILVDTYDMWRVKDLLWNEAQNLNRVMYATAVWDAGSQYCYNNFIDSIINKLKSCKNWEWNENEKKAIYKMLAIENNTFKKSNEMLQFRTDEKGKKFGLFKASSKISIVCSRLLEKYKELDYIIAINTYLPQKRKMSIRSTGFDVTQLKDVKGHLQAAGFQYETMEQVADFWKGTVNSLPYKE